MDGVLQLRIVLQLIASLKGAGNCLFPNLTPPVPIEPNRFVGSNWCGIFRFWVGVGGVCSLIRGEIVVIIWWNPVVNRSGRGAL